jgi:hypothetical protein
LIGYTETTSAVGTGKVGLFTPTVFAATAEKVVVVTAVGTGRVGTPTVSAATAERVVVVTAA